MSSESLEMLTRSLTSPVWTYFKVCEDNPVMADCTLCGTRMSRGGSAPNRCGTTNLRRHILYSHKITLPSTKKGSIDNGTRKKQLKRSSIISKKNAANKNNENKKIAQALKKSVVKENMENSAPQHEPVMCIKWNTYLTNMTSALPDLLHDEQFVDVTLACEGQSLKCHKILLAACSPYFYDLLSSASCRHPIIMFKDYHFWELQALVAFMYCGEVNVPQSQLPRILHVAEALQIKGLAKPASQNTPSIEELQPLHEPETEYLDEKPKDLCPASSKRKRKPSSHNCCKASTKNTKTKLKHCSTVKAKIPKKKVAAPKKRKVSPAKKVVQNAGKKSTPSAKSPKRKKSSEDLESILSNPLDQQLPELLPEDVPDMLNDILSLKDTADITEGISLPVAHKMGSVDGIFPLEDLEGMKMEMDGDEPEIEPYLSNGLNHSDHDQLDLLPPLNPDCRLDEDGDGDDRR